MNGFHGEGAPPPERRKDVFFIDPIGPGKRTQFRIWSPQVWGVWTHFHDTTTPCYECNNHCQEGHDPKTLRWKGYLLGMNFGYKKPTFVQFTAACYYQLMEQIAPGVSLRGMMVFFTRTAKKNGRQGIAIEEYQRQEPDTCPPDCSPRASLYNLWKEPDPGWKWTLKPILRLHQVGPDEKEAVS
jgi:hypothetical protein